MRILIVKLSSLGDLFHALPAVHKLKVCLGAEIDWVTQEEYVDVVRCFTDVDKVLPFYRKRFLSHVRPFVRELRAREYDVVLDLQGLLKSAVVGRLARAGECMGPSFHREGAALLYDRVLGRRDKGRHAVDEMLEVAGGLGASSGEVAFPVRFPLTDLGWDGAKVAMLPASRWPSKNWPAARFAEVATAVCGSGRVRLYLLGGAGDWRVCEDIKEDVEGNVVNLAGTSGFVEMGSLLQEMDVVIANDSGPLHVAVALGIPSVAVYGPTDPARTGPYGQGHTVLCARLPCQPCLSRVCRRGRALCLDEVRAADVAEAALRMLAGCAGVGRRGRGIGGGMGRTA